MNDLFPILAIETSGEICSASVMISENVYAEHNIMKKHIHSEKLLPVIEYLMKDLGITAKDLNVVAVSMGPGSFTGLRIGMAAAKGIALGANCAVCPVPTFDAVALSIAESLNDEDKFAVVVNTNIEEVYTSFFEVIAGKPKRIGETELVKKTQLYPEKFARTNVYGDVNFIDKIKPLRLNSIDIARWTYFSGKDLLISNFDLLEPSYFKNFVARIKK